MSKNEIKNKKSINLKLRNEPRTQPNKITKKPENKNNIVYEYPISLLKEPTQFEKYKERLLLSGKPKKEKIIINPNYHHISFKSHSKSLLLNPNIIFDNIQNKNLIQIYRNIFKSMNQFETNNTNKLSQFLQRNNSTPRGFNYKKIKISSLQRIALQNFSKLDENFLPTDKINETGFILESNKRNVLPLMKTFYANKLNLMKFKKECLNENKFKIDCNQKPVINIKNDPNFKFHIYHDKNGKIRDLGKSKERNLKMTGSRMRDLILYNKIRQIRDPEIIQKYKTAIIEK